MPNSSWSRKVARAAGTGGGKTNRGRIPWSYYALVALIIVLGVVGVVLSKNAPPTASATATTNPGVPPQIGQTENEAIAFYFCGSFAPNVPQAKADPYGLTTQGDGIMHITPTKAIAAGDNATLGKWAGANRVTLSSTQVQIPKSKLYRNGDACEGGKGKVYVKQFAFAGDTAGVIVKGDPRSIHLEDQAELVVAFVPPSKSGTIPGPPAAIVAKLKSLATSASPTTSSPSPASATTAPAGSAPTAPAGSATTAPAGSATTAPAGSATTAPAGSATTAPATKAGTASSAPTTAASPPPTS